MSGALTVQYAVWPSTESATGYASASRLERGRWTSSKGVPPGQSASKAESGNATRIASFSP